MNLLKKKSKACMMIVASMIGGAVVCAVTVICVLLVKGGGGESVTEEANAETAATSTPKGTTLDSEVISKTPKTTKSPVDTANSATAGPPVTRVRVTEGFIK